MATIVFNLNGFFLQNNITDNKQRRRIGFALLKDIIKRSPIATGYSKSRWRVKVQNPNELFARGDLSTPAENRANLAEIELTTQPLDVIISNDANYISFLEAGHSKQAPNGMIKPALLAMSTKLNQGSFKASLNPSAKLKAEAANIAASIVKGKLKLEAASNLENLRTTIREEDELLADIQVGLQEEQRAALLQALVSPSFGLTKDKDVLASIIARLNK